MADCGATGSAIDRTAESVARAGKVVAGFFGSVATNSSASPSFLSHGMKIPKVQPQTITAPLNHSNYALDSIISHSDPIVVPATPHISQHVNHPQYLMSPNASQQSTINIHHMNHNQFQAQMHMQSQMQFMAQQMKLMNLQQQYQHQQPLEQVKSTVSEKNAHNEMNEWYNHLEEEFESYMQSYRRGGVSKDVESTADLSEIGHDGLVEDASIEQLAAAWAEAETSFAFKDQDITNLADPYNSDFGSHLHYDFSETSRQAKIKPGFDFMQEGMSHFHDGNIAEAIMCFESELLNNGMDNADAWLMLGKCNAENDEDRKAIISLENAVERDPYSSDALLALGVSYVNELNHESALKNLKSWITNNPHYVGLDSTLDTSQNGEDGALLKFKALLNKAKEYDESNGNNESTVGVLEALGVVCNVTREYDEAVKYFKLATAIRPEDYTLWNKLGATLANSNKSNEAQEAYQRALGIKPKYARAWLNMAISHSNLKNYGESARCYLQTLSLNPRATHVWSYLRIALTCSERWDLLTLAANQDLNGFREHFDFI